jgi:hypothetical protein
MSKKFTNAQQHYAVHELETLAILEALQKWEDKLVGHKFHVITDHKALEFFQNQAQLSNQQRRWIDYLSRFDFNITYIKGKYNKVADCLSRYFESDTSSDKHGSHNYVQADRRIDPKGEDLPMGCQQEIKDHTVETRVMRATTVRRSSRLHESWEPQEEEAQELQQSAKEHTDALDKPHQGTEKDSVMLGDILGALPARAMPTTNRGSEEEDRHLLQSIKDNYEWDPLTRTVLANPDNHKQYLRITDGVIWTKNFHDTEVICVPRENSLITQLLTKAHEIMGHYGDQHTCEYVRCWYWWPQMAKSTTSFCKMCEACQRSKSSMQKPTGKLHLLPIPMKPWDSIGIDFVGPFPKLRGHNYLWVIICHMASSIHLVLVTINVTVSELSWKYLREIVRLHGLPGSIVSNRDSKFML